MAHLSEGATPLTVRHIKERIANVKPNGACVEFIILPYYNNLSEVEDKNKLYENLANFIDKVDENTTIALLTSPILAADFINYKGINEYYKLWVPIKLKNPLVSDDYIDRNHCSLIILGKYKQAIIHTKTRISYSYCPSCDKTTKDYGGKKHLYDEFGTIMSDVWRDISVDTDKKPTDVIDRLKDLFGLPNYEFLNVYDQREFLSKKHAQEAIYKVFNDETSNVELNSELINGDCIERLKAIPSNSVDFCFADPPYNIKKKYNNWNDALDIKEYFEWCDEWLTELARILKPGRTLAILNIPKWTIRHFKHLNEILDYQDWIVWEGLSIPAKNIVPLHYSILCFSKGKPRRILNKERKNSSLLEEKSIYTLSENFCLRPACVKHRRITNQQDKEIITNIWWDIHRLMHNSRRVDHPCQLPPNFMYRLISLFTYEKEFIVDPFNGVGTTTLCAAILKRNYIGIELSDYYHNIAIERHKEVINGIDPFRKNNNDSQNVKNSRIERLEKQKYKVSKKTLQLEVKEITKRIGRLPTKEELFSISNYPSEYFEKYFVNWGEVYAAARTTGMSETRESIQFEIFNEAT